MSRSAAALPSSPRAPVPPSRPVSPVVVPVAVVPVFAQAAEAIADEARALRLVVPGFRSPPRPGLLRSLRRHPSGAVTVAVAVQGRSPAAVVADMVEGLVRANGLAGAAADGVRSQVGARLRRAGLPSPVAGPGSLAGPGDLAGPGAADGPDGLVARVA